jgi:2-(1,2-epoxy-1,2-dihydrophenyl)acetyl-CoA isomerase
MSGGVQLDHTGAIATVTLSNPEKRNAFSPDMRRELTALMNTLMVESETRAIVLTGAGGHFCAGADLSRVDESKPPATALETRQNLREVHILIRTLFAGPKPVIAAVEGIAFGGGFSIALACDWIVAAKTARFGAAFAKLGIVGDMGVNYTLKARIGLVATRRMLTLGAEINGEEAVRIGVADELAEPGAALATALVAAEAYARAAPLAAAYTKAAYGNGIETLEDAFRAELDYLPVVVQSADFREALTAFKEKRPPAFTGK